MGCACLRVKRLNIIDGNKTGDINNVNNKKFLSLNNPKIIRIDKTILNKINYINKLSKNLWLRVIDFLGFKDLSQTGKTNKLFNNLSKSFQILTKFFKNKTIKINGVYNKNNNLTTNISNNIIYINPNLNNSSMSSIPSFQKSSFMQSSRMYFSSNNNSSSNGTIGSLQKTLNNLKYLKAQTNKNLVNLNNKFNNNINFNTNNFNNKNTISNNIQILNESLTNNTIQANLANNLYNVNDNLSELDNFLLSKILDSNPILYKDIFNRSELDFSKIKFENSKNSSLNKTPTFSSFAISDALNVSANNPNFFGNCERNYTNSQLLDQNTTNNNNIKVNLSSNNCCTQLNTNCNTNNFSKFHISNQDLNIIYEDNKFESNEKEEINFLES